MKLQIPYDTTYQTAIVPDEKILGILRPQVQPDPALDEADVLHAALEHPIGTPRLCELAEGCAKILVITSDHTRPLPSKKTLPVLLAELRRSNPQAEVKILIGTGLHRAMTPEEHEGKFGGYLMQTETFICHDGYDMDQLTYKGVLPSGNPLWLNALIDWADLVVSEGFIEPHFFAGFSGGRKSILPGIAGAPTIRANHCAEFIADPHAGAGKLAGNPIHADMCCAAEQAGLRFILNVILDEDKRICHAVAGDPIAAHEAGCAYLKERCQVPAMPAEIVITSNGGYPLDQNIYQAVKGLTAAEATSKKGGWIIMVASCKDGHGGEAFYQMLKDCPDIRQRYAELCAVPREQTQSDQWMAQILARILTEHTVVFVAEPSQQNAIEEMGMIYAGDLSEAVLLATEQLGEDAAITVIPDGVGVVVAQADCD